MKTILAIVAMVLLVGCAKIDGWEIHRANTICADHLGVDYLQHLLGGSFGRCVDGKTFRLE